MKSLRIYLVSAIVILSLTVAAITLTKSERYYPQVRVSLPDHSELIFIESPWSEQEKCIKSNQSTAGTLRANCSQCKIEDRCEKTTDSSWLAALAGEQVSDYVVHSGERRIVVRAGDASKQTCMAMAEQISNSGKQTARCVLPLQ